MVNSTPQWTFLSPRLAYRFDQVRLLQTRVLGQWCCLNRSDGQLLWQKRFWRPNTVCGIVDQVIIATEAVRAAFVSGNYGCYGISLETGKLLWSSHGSGWWGSLLRFCDYLPSFTNEYRDAPHHVLAGEVACWSGRVLNAQTGEERRQVSPEEIRRHTEPKSPARELYDGVFANQRTRVKVAEGLWLSHKKALGVLPGFRLYLLDDQDNVRWEFDPATTGLTIGGNFYSYRYASFSAQPACVYIVASEEPNERAHSTKPYHVIPSPTRHHLLTLDVLSGRIVDDFVIDEDRVTGCQIEDIDAGGLLLSVEGTKLKYYQTRYLGCASVD